MRHHQNHQCVDDEQKQTKTEQGQRKREQYQYGSHDGIGKTEQQCRNDE